MKIWKSCRRPLVIRAICFLQIIPIYLYSFPDFCHNPFLWGLPLIIQYLGRSWPSENLRRPSRGCAIVALQRPRAQSRISKLTIWKVSSLSGFWIVWLYNYTWGGGLCGWIVGWGSAIQHQLYCMVLFWAMQTDTVYVIVVDNCDSSEIHGRNYRNPREGDSVDQ